MPLGVSVPRAQRSAVASDASSMMPSDTPPIPPPTTKSPPPTTTTPSPARSMFLARPLPLPRAAPAPPAAAVAAAPTQHLLPLLARPGEWDLLIAHWLGVDHAGHTYGVASTQMADKLAQMDDQISRVIGAWRGLGCAGEAERVGAGITST